MKSTLEIPDDLLDQVRAEAARQRKSIEEILPDLVRAGLQARYDVGLAQAAMSPSDVAQFLCDLRDIGSDIQAHSVDPRSAVEILQQDRR